MVNRLSESSSDYLRQHAHQGVDWWEWSPEALAAATRRDGSGRMPFAAFPSLRYQHRDYLVARLEHFHEAEGPHSTSNALGMDLAAPHAGSRLDDASIRALAAWLAALPPG